MGDKKSYLIIKILSILGVLLAVFLLWEQFARSSFQPCNINAVVNCDAVISGDVAKTFGISTPLYGLIGYIVIFIAAVFAKKKLLLGTALFGLIFCLWIAYIELFKLHVICPVCIGCQVVMVVINIVSIQIFKNKTSK